MKSYFVKAFFKGCLIVIITLLNFAVAYSQDILKDKQLNEAINNVNNSNFEQAVPVLKKYSEMKVFDDFKTLEINIYLNFCYFLIKKEAINIGKVNSLTDAYLAKYGISKTDSIRRGEEISLLLIASSINGKLGNNEKMVF
jgi:hypothetical protein